MPGGIFPLHATPISLQGEFIKTFPSMAMRVSKRWSHLCVQNILSDSIILGYLWTKSSPPQLLLYLLCILFIHNRFLHTFERSVLKKLFYLVVDDQAIVSSAWACIGKWMHIFDLLDQAQKPARLLTWHYVDGAWNNTMCSVAKSWRCACGIYFIPIYEDCCTQIDYCSVCD